jgi:phenylacetic acid degradation operon negative regulatory protein
MRKLLRPRDYLLLTFALLGDAFEEIRDPFSIHAEGCKYLYGWIPERWQKHHFQRAAKRMLKTGEIVKEVVKGRPVIRLSSCGEEMWSREFPLFKLSQKPWDGWWRIISFDIPEKLKGRRDYLRKKIERLGMGKMQESLYITPFDFGKDLKEYIDIHGLSDFVDVFEARHIFGYDPKKLAWRVWRLEKLEERYRELLEAFSHHNALTIDNRHSLQVKFEEILLDDPLLPKELLPYDWVGFRARKIVLGN